MKNQELFDKTVSILVKAYLDDMLDYGEPCGCAVGNLVAAGMGYKILKCDGGFTWQKSHTVSNYAKWGQAIDYMQGAAGIRYGSYIGEAKQEIDSTGYSVCELANIEYAFFKGSTSDVGCEYESEEDELKVQNFNGLMYVIDAVMLIHEATIEEAEQAKQLFVQPS